MERDNFDQLLKDVVSKSDHQIINSNGKERVWKAVKQPNKSRKLWLFIAAAAAIICLILLIFQEKETPKLVIAKKPESKKQTLEIQKTSSSEEKVSAASAIELIEKKDVNMPIAQTKVGSQDTLIPIILNEMSVLEADVSQNVAINPATQNQQVEISKPEIKPEFTVQFKRGKPKETLLDKQMREARASLLKVRFGRDTATTANAEEKSSSILKIKF